MISIMKNLIFNFLIFIVLMGCSKSSNENGDVFTFDDPSVPYKSVSVNVDTINNCLEGPPVFIYQTVKGQIYKGSEYYYIHIDQTCSRTGTIWSKSLQFTK